MTLFRLYLLRGMYLLVGLGLALTNWQEWFGSQKAVANEDSVIQMILLAFCLLAFLGLRYPVRMIPLLIFELLWKSLWLLMIALPAWQRGELGEYGAGVAVACLVGVVLTPLALPWKYILRHYVFAQGDPWRGKVNAFTRGEAGAPQEWTE